VTNLHALWDSVILSESEDLKLPLSNASWTKLGEVSKTLREKYPNQEKSFLASV